MPQSIFICFLVVSTIGAHGSNSTEGWEMVNIFPKLPVALKDGYKPSCDLKSDQFELNNTQDPDFPPFDRKLFSWVSVLQGLELLAILLVVYMLPPKFPISPSQHWRAPKTFLISSLEKELNQLETLSPGDEGCFLFGPKDVKVVTLKHVLAALQGTHPEDSIQKEERRLDWSKDPDEFTALELDKLLKGAVSATIATAIANSDNDESTSVERVEMIEWWVRTLLFRCCFDPKDSYRMLGFNLAAAHLNSYDFDKEASAQFMEVQMKHPATKMGVAVPWSQSMQILIAAISSFSSLLSPLLSMIKSKFWLWYTDPGYWALSFRAHVLFGVLYNLCKAYVGLKAWNTLTGNDNVIWQWNLTRTSFQFNRLVGGPLGQKANIYIYIMAGQMLLQINFAPPLFFWIVFLAGLSVVILVCYSLLVLLLILAHRWRIARGADITTLREGLLSPRLVQSHTLRDEIRSAMYVVIQRENWRVASPECRPFVIAGIVTLLVLPLVIPEWLSLVNQWQPDSSGTYLCTYSRLQLFSMRFDSISGFTFLSIVLGLALGSVAFLLRCNKVLMLTVDVQTHAFHMFLWQSLQAEHPLEKAINAYSKLSDDMQYNAFAFDQTKKAGLRDWSLWWLRRAQTNLDSWSSLPEKLKTKDLYTRAVQQDLCALRYVPENVSWSEALYTEAVEQDVSALELIPENRKTEALCTKAVQQDGRALMFVPKNMMTEALCTTAVQQDGPAFMFVPKSMRTEALCTKAVQQDGGNLHDVPENMKTEALCTTAVQQDGRALAWVPENMRTEALCTTAVQQDGSRLVFVPENMMTEALCTTAVRQRGLVLEHVPENMRTEALCTKAVQQDGWALQFVPESMRTEALCTTAVQQDGRALKHVPKNMKTEALCTTAVQQNWSAIMFAPENMETEETKRSVKRQLAESKDSDLATRVDELSSAADDDHVLAIKEEGHAVTGAASLLPPGSSLASAQNADTEAIRKDVSRKGYITFEEAGQEFEVKFSCRPLGLSFAFENELFIVVSSVQGHAKELGVKVGWIIKAIDGVPVKGKEFKMVDAEMMTFSESLPEV